MRPKRILGGHGARKVHPKMSSNAKIISDNNANSRTPILDGSAIAPRQATGPDWYLCDPCFVELYEKEYKPHLTPREAWRLMGYNYDLSVARVTRKMDQLTDEQWDDCYALKEKLMNGYEREIAARKKGLNKTHVNYELGPREFTFTYSPTWFDDNNARKMMTLAIERLQRYYINDIVEFHARGEVGKNGLSHVHCYYELKGGLKITDKNFKRAYPKWNPSKKTSKKGFEGGHHETVKVSADFKGYIEEDDAFNWLKVDVNNKQNAIEEDLSQEAHQSSQAWVPTYHP